MYHEDERPAGSTDLVKHGLVMEGGSMRGMFTSGVIDIFMEEGIDFDGAVGTSAGATFGCNFKSRQIGRAFRYTRRFCRDYRYGSLLSLLKTGNVFDVNLCYEEIPWKLDLWDAKTFRENPMDFYVVASDIESGKAVYYKMYKGEREDIAWIRASASMPLFASIVEIDGRKFLDGGVTDSVALRFMEKMGFKKNVVILTKPQAYVREQSILLPLIRLKYRKYPNLIKACEKRPEIYNATIKYIEKRAKKEAAFIIQPPVDLDVGRLESDPEKLERAYNMGRDEAIKNLDAIRQGGFCK